MNLFKKSALSASICSVLAGLAAPGVSAATFNWGEIEGSFDSTFSVGVSIRAEDRNFDDLVGKVNHPGVDWTGYTAFGNTIYQSTDLFELPGSFSSNGDLSNLAWSKGDAFSKVVKGLHELDLRYENYGFFVRGMYYYDFALADDLDYSRALDYPGASNRGIDVCRDDEASELACKDVRLLDAYFTADYDFGEVPVSFRIGQQVISWGESTLISHGIGSINAVDIGRLRTPGAELKEAFIPQGMAWMSAQLTEAFGVEVFYQYDWEPIRVPVGGTYFASNDFISDGGQYNMVQLGFNSNPDIDSDFVVHELQQLAALASSGQVPQEQLALMMLAYPTRVALRDKEIDAKDDGQYGIKLTYFSEELNNTEFGLYFMNYHSRRPLISGQASNFTQEAIGRDLARVAAAGDNLDIDTLSTLETFTKAQIVYPEDIKLTGVSFNTTFGDTSVAGEIAHRQDEPLQIDDVELLFAAMPQQLANAGLRPELDGISQMQVFEPGAVAQGFVLSDTTQAQMTFTHIFGPTLGSDNLVVLAEVGGVWIHDMPDQDELRLNGPGTGRSGGKAGNEAIIQSVHAGPETNPFPTDHAWGYRLVAKADFNNVFAGVNMSSRAVFSHDVDGITPDPMFLFTEGQKSVGLSVDFDYQNRWAASVGYNAFWGGLGTTNAMEDKDFVSFSVKYSI